MNCPVAMVDYESALVGADWYEEQGEILIAEQIRYRANGADCFYDRWHINNMIGTYSHCGSKHLRSWQESWSISRMGSRHVSTSTAHIGYKQISKSHSRTLYK